MKFFPKRQQSLADLERQPPCSLAHLRALLSTELSGIDAAVGTLEADFYEGAPAVDFVRRFFPPVNAALNAHRLSELSSLRQLETVIRFARDPEVAETAASLPGLGKPARVSKEAAEALLHLQNRLLEFVPGRFADLIHRCQQALELCERYLRPFYETGLDPPVETAKLYAASVQVWADRVRHCVAHLYQLPQLFLRGGLSLARLSRPALDILERCDMLPCPIVGIFPDCCERLREATRHMAEWMRQDELYTLYLRNDLGDLEKARKANNKSLKNAKHRMSMRHFRLKQLQSERARLTVELETLSEKEAELIVDDEALYQEVNARQVDIEIKEFRRDGLKRNTEKSRYDIQVTWDQLTEELRQLKMRLPVLRRQQASVRLKIDWIEQKRAEHKQLSDQIHALEETLWSERRVCIDEQTELEKIVASIDKNKEIQRLKSSPDVLKKIFFHMPLLLDKDKPTARATPGRDSEASNGTPTRLPPIPDCRSPRGYGSGQGHEFERVLALVGSRVGRDWPRLYRALPFVPIRGDETIDSDVRDIESDFVGDALKERAKRALQRWRRFHTRARVEDLCQAVSLINRQDLVDAIDAVLHPVDLTADTEEPIPDSLPKDLIPYYREVVKFDRLRAAHRI